MTTHIHCLIRHEKLSTKSNHNFFFTLYIYISSMDTTLVKGLLIHDSWKNKRMPSVSWRVINISPATLSTRVLSSRDLGFPTKMLGESNIDWENVSLTWGLTFINHKLDISKFFNDTTSLSFKQRSLKQISLNLFSNPYLPRPRQTEWGLSTRFSNFTRTEGFFTIEGKSTRVTRP